MPERHGLTFAADGIHSPARAGAQPEIPARIFTGQVAWRATVPDDGQPARRRRMCSWDRAGISCATRSGRGGSSTSWLWRNATPGAAEGWHHTDDPEATCAAPSPISAPSCAACSTGSMTVHLWGLFRHPGRAGLDRRGTSRFWATRRIPTLPFLAQGANMALEDAWSLVAALVRRSR
jgi:salicylate hydroxylase